MKQQQARERLEDILASDEMRINAKAGQEIERIIELLADPQPYFNDERITIVLNVGNAAFDDKGPEVARILIEIAEAIKGGGPLPSVLLDVNGNACGTLAVDTKK